jgi:transcriptional regulator with XRE-family HTH domain
MARETGALTEFGERCRSLRMSRDILMADQARAMGVSSAFLSAVETGAKPIPADHVDRMVHSLKLTVDEHAALRQAADASAKLVKVRPPNGAAAKMVVELALSIERLTPKQIKQLRTIIKGAQ